MRVIILRQAQDDYLFRETNSLNTIEDQIVSTIFGVRKLCLCPEAELLKSKETHNEACKQFGVRKLCLRPAAELLDSKICTTKCAYSLECSSSACAQKQSFWTPKSVRRSVHTVWSA